MTPQLVSPTVAIGVTGHRVLADTAGLSKTVRAVLAQVRKAAEAALDARENPVAGGHLNLRIVSPIAEGADRLVAQAGLELGATLQCPLPFPRDDYAADFKSRASKAAFRDLLSRAERVFELDAPEVRDDGYAAVGRMVVSQSDILIAIWDGKPAKGHGGTAEVVADALARGVPVVLLQPRAKGPPVVLAGSLDRPTRHGLETLDEAVRRLVTPPKQRPDDDLPATSLQTFADETKPVLALPNFFDGFLRCVQFKLPRIRHVPHGHWLDESLGAWRAPFAGHDAVRLACAPCLDEKISRPFARSDVLANQYAGLYRSTFLANFGLSALAVLAALCGRIDRLGVGPGIVEFAIILMIAGFVLLAHHRQYHERWIDYRHLAEQIRPLRFLMSLGLTLPTDSAAHYLERERGSGTWGAWLAHRIEREIGLPDVAITPAYLAAVKAFVSQGILEEQIRYHKDTAAKFAKVDHTLHIAGLGLFISTGALCLVHIGLSLSFHPGMSSNIDGLEQLILIVSGFLPALGAATWGVRNVGEFVRLEKRSKAMQAALEHAQAALEKLFGGGLPSRAALGAELEALAVQMMAEAADWRTLVITRRIELPS